MSDLILFCSRPFFILLSILLIFPDTNKKYEYPLQLIADFYVYKKYDSLQVHIHGLSQRDEGILTHCHGLGIYIYEGPEHGKNKRHGKRCRR